MSFLAPKAQKPTTAVPAAPERTDADIQDMAAQQRRKFYQEFPGRRSTLGGGLDVMGLYPTSSARLLGAA